MTKIPVNFIFPFWCVRVLSEQFVLLRSASLAVDVGSVDIFMILEGCHQVP